MRSDPDSVRWSQLRPGVIALVAIFTVSAVVFSLDLVLRELSEGAHVTVVAQEARDLRPGAEVWVAGVPAGRVTRVGFQHPDEDHAGRVVVRAVLHGNAGELLRSDASAEIRASALLAPPVLDLSPGGARDPLTPADTLRVEPPLSGKDVMASMEGLRGRMERLAPELERLATRLERGPGTLASLRRNPAVTEDLRRAGAELRTLARSEGTLALMAADTALAARMRRVRGRLDSLEADATGAASWSSLASDAARLRTRLDTLTARVEAGRGSAGRFLTDRELVEAMERVRARLDSVRGDLLSHPFRWLRFRVF